MKLIEKFENIMDKLSMPMTLICGGLLFARVIASFVFNV
jgi:hypothetical protein